MLESAGLILQERDPNQKQRILFYPVVENTNNTEEITEELKDF